MNPLWIFACIGVVVAVTAASYTLCGYGSRSNCRNSRTGIRTGTGKVANVANQLPDLGPQPTLSREEQRGLPGIVLRSCPPREEKNYAIDHPNTGRKRLDVAARFSLPITLS
jgi:hypothetical protein